MENPVTHHSYRDDDSDNNEEEDEESEGEAIANRKDMMGNDESTSHGHQGQKGEGEKSAKGNGEFVMDKSWMQIVDLPSAEYQNGVRQFLDFACANAGAKSTIRCPCLKCHNCCLLTRDDVKYHLLTNGVMKCYTNWIYHGEPCDSDSDDDSDEQDVESEGEAMANRYLAYEAMQFHRMFSARGEYMMDDECTSHGRQVQKGKVEKSARGNGDAQQPLYPGCTHLTKQSFTEKLMELQSTNSWTDECMDAVLELVRELLPEGSTTPASFDEAKELVSGKGLGTTEKIFSLSSS